MILIEEEVRGGSNPIGIVTTTATSTVGIAATFSYEENSNFTFKFLLQ